VLSEHVQYRQANNGDLHLVLDLFGKTVRTINIKDYSKKQVEAWVESGSNPEQWLRRIQKQYMVIAEADSGTAGFASITNQGYLDVLFVDPAFQGRGIARALMDRMVDYARQKKVKQISAEVSITARSFFEYQGFELLHEQQVQRKGVSLTNYKMKKDLIPG